MCRQNCFICCCCCIYARLTSFFGHKNILYCTINSVLFEMAALKYKFGSQLIAFSCCLLSNDTKLLSTIFEKYADVDNARARVSGQMVIGEPILLFFKMNKFEINKRNQMERGGREREIIHIHDKDEIIVYSFSYQCHSSIFLIMVDR